MKIREFVNAAGDRYIVKEYKENDLEVFYVPFSDRINNWESIDNLKANHSLEYEHQYDAINIKY